MPVRNAASRQLKWPLSCLPEMRLFHLIALQIGDTQHRIIAFHTLRRLIQRILAMGMVFGFKQIDGKWA